MSNPRCRFGALAALIAGIAALAAAGCGSNGPSTTTGRSAQSGRQNGDATAAYAYARCMRSHGVTSFPDPKVSISAGHGSVAFAVNPSETGSPHFHAAQKACNGILPSPSNSTEDRAHKQTLLAFARCLRARGVQDFPDPNVRGQLRLQTVIAAGVDVHSRTFLSAAEACVGVTHGEITMAQIRAGINGGD